MTTHNFDRAATVAFLRHVRDVYVHQTGRTIVEQTLDYDKPVPLGLPVRWNGRSFVVVSYSRLDTGPAVILREYDSDTITRALNKSNVTVASDETIDFLADQECIRVAASFAANTIGYVAPIVSIDVAEWLLQRRVDYIARQPKSNRHPNHDAIMAVVDDSDWDEYEPAVRQLVGMLLGTEAAITSFPGIGVPIAWADCPSRTGIITERAQRNPCGKVLEADGCDWGDLSCQNFRLATIKETRAMSKRPAIAAFVAANAKASQSQ